MFGKKNRKWKIIFFRKMNSLFEATSQLASTNANSTNVTNSTTVAPNNRTPQDSVANLKKPQKMHVQKRDGTLQPVHFDKIVTRIEQMCEMEPKLDQNYIDPANIAMKVIEGMFNGVKTSELDGLAAETAAYRSTQHTDFETLAARLDISNLQKSTTSDFVALQRRLYDYVHPLTGKHAPLIARKTLDFAVRNAEAIQAALCFERDFANNYFGFKTLCRGYLLKCDGNIVERPQCMLMRVAIGIHGTENDADDEQNCCALVKVLETYDLLSKRYFTHATPTLFNAGTCRPQMSSCFLLSMVGDSIEGIYETLKRCALISKSAGGIGVAISNIRASQSYIAGTGGKSNGLVPMLRVFNDTARYVDQCFTGETMVYTDAEPKTIASLQVGDNVLTQQGNYCKVERVLEHDYKGSLLEIQLADNDATICVTTEHQVFLANIESRQFSEQSKLRKNVVVETTLVDACELRVGDLMCFPVNKQTNHLSLLNGARTVGKQICVPISAISVRDATTEIKTYDLEVAEEHTYVTALGSVHNGGGKRKGAFAMYLEPWHADLFTFLELKKNHGKEEERARDLFYGLWIPDLFMERVESGGKWSLFCPNEAPGLQEAVGDDFKKLYESYEAQGLARQTIEAQALWHEIVSSQIETGTPYILYKDACNKKSNQQHLGTIKSSNLCCIAADQRVPTDRGIMTIGELYKNGGENKVVGRTGIVDASPMLLPRPDAPMRKIVTKEGYTHKVTPDHKVWVEKFGWKEAQNLVKGDRISIQQREGLWGTQDFPKEAFLAGLITGDGTLSKNQAGEYCSVCIDIWECDKNFKSQIEIMVEQVIAEHFTADDINWRMNNAPKFIECKIRDGSCKKYRLHSNLLFRVLKKLGMNMENKQSVPDFVWKGTKQTVSKYLEGLYLADGHIQGNKEISSVVLAQSNKPFLQEIQILWANYGAKTSLTLMKEAGQSTFPCGGTYNTKAMYRLLSTSVRASRIIEETTHLAQHRCETRESNTPVQFLQNLASKTGYKQKLYAHFECLEELPNEDAYCLEVFTEEHSWTVNGVITKNTEIIEYTSPDEVAVCNLASIALPMFLKTQEDGTQFFDHDLLVDVVRKVTYNLNQIIDRNYYPIKEAKNSNLRHRPIGIGVQGLADLFLMCKIDYDSPEAAKLNREIFETMYFAALSESCELAKQHGPYESYAGSPMSEGKLQFDLWNKSPESERTDIKVTRRHDWQALRQKIAKYGVRNSLLLAPMPTASTSQILGNNETFEPYTSNIYTRRVLAGEFVVVNKHLVRELLALGLWNEEMKNKIVANRGSVQNITELPEDLRRRYRTVWELSMKPQIDMAAERGIYICQSQSFNAHIADPDSKKLSSMHFYAWKKGLKTGQYYLRSRAAVDAIQFTLQKSKELKSGQKLKVEPAGEICTMQEGCLSCGS